MNYVGTECFLKFYDKCVNIKIFTNHLSIKLIYLLGSVSTRFGCSVFDHLRLRCAVSLLKIISIQLFWDVTQKSFPQLVWFQEIYEFKDGRIREFADVSFRRYLIRHLS